MEKQVGVCALIVAEKATNKVNINKFTKVVFNLLTFSIILQLFNMIFGIKIEYFFQIFSVRFLFLLLINLFNFILTKLLY